MTRFVQAEPNMVLIYHYVKEVFPKVKKALRHWESLAESIPERVLSEQAMDSLQRKAFHCLGGSIYSLYPGVNTDEVIEFIVAYQTISDYLDNLVDAVNVQDEKAFAQLHRAMTEALEPETELTDYYAYYPYRDDGGYLATLVKTCQDKAKNLPSYSLVKTEMLGLAKLYSFLQTTKHLDRSVREEKMLRWINEYILEYPGLSEWEFAAATGSTLGIFCLHAAAFNPELQLEEVRKIKEAYFPWIAGLHILLDYFIDLLEDRETAQLNFVEYYSSSEIRAERLRFFVRKSLSDAQNLSHTNFHRAVIKGLLAMYLSDEKGKLPELVKTTQQLISTGGTEVKILYWLCSQLRRRDIL